MFVTLSVLLRVSCPLDVNLCCSRYFRSCLQFWFFWIACVVNIRREISLTLSDQSFQAGKCVCGWVSGWVSRSHTYLFSARARQDHFYLHCDLHTLMQIQKTASEKWLSSVRRNSESG